MLIVTGHVQLAPLDVASFVGDMAASGDAARARDRRLFFAVAPDDPRTGPVVVERRRNQAALDAHLAADEPAAFVARWRGPLGNALAKFDASNERALMAPLGEVGSRWRCERVWPPTI